MADTARGTAVVAATPPGVGDLEANRALQRRYYGEMDVRGGSPDVVDAFFAPDATVHVGGMPSVDLRGFKGILAGFYSAFPEMVHHIEAQVAEGDLVVARNRVTTTHRGEFQGVPATGRSVTVDAMVWQRIAGGRIAEMWVLVDMAGLMQQLTRPG